MNNLIHSDPLEALLQFAFGSSMFVQDVDIEQTAYQQYKICVRLSPLFFDSMRKQYIRRTTWQAHHEFPYLKRVEVLAFRGY